MNAQGSGYGFSHLRAKAVYWHRGGTQVTYRLDTTRKPVHAGKSTTRQSDTGMVHFAVPWLTRHEEYKEYTYIKAEEDKRKRNPMSVLYYVDNSTLYYDFPESD